MSSTIHFCFSIFTLAILTIFTISNALGSGSTIAIISNTTTVCGIVAGKSSQRIECYHQGQLIQVEPNVSYQSISGGNSFFCGLRSGGFALQCWDTDVVFNSSFQPKRIHYNNSDPLSDVSVGGSQVCALGSVTKNVYCWRGEKSGKSQFMSPSYELEFFSVTSGHGFSCGVSRNNSRVVCWGESTFGGVIEEGFSNYSMLSLVAGYSHACGLNSSGSLVCKGNNDSGQLDVPSDGAFEFSEIALGVKHSCAIRLKNGLVECWGGGDKGMEFASNVIQNESFESVAAGLDFTCGLTTGNFSLICWGPGWFDKGKSTSDIPLPTIVPGPCVQTSCRTCGTYPNSETLCAGSGTICKTCAIQLPLPWIPPFPSSSPPTSSNTARDERFLAFVIVGSVGAFAGICTIIYCVFAGVCRFLCKISRKVEEAPSEGDNVETISAPTGAPNVPPSRSSSIKQHSLRALERQKSGPSLKQADKPEKFSLAELSAATANFSPENIIGSGSFGMVYKGKLSDGREVAIKRGGTRLRPKKFKEKESAFESELALLSRLHHKHLVGLVGYCKENDERLLVYEYMSNGSLHDHLHSKKNVEKDSSILNSWKVRIRIALDAARGIEYLHNYAVPPIIHRDIKSSNILLDSNWTARVSDFGLSLMGPEADREFMSTKAVGTVGYIDPEYYVLNVLTAKSDVYGMGVVLLELLTGKKAVFRDEEEGAGPTGVVEYAVSEISAGELSRVLDMRIGLPKAIEVQAVELVAYTALHCVNLEGKERPTMTEVAANLERALALCEEAHAGLSNSAYTVNDG
ncbi:hypothetical protein RJ641_005221 [Dillenia turbinata]|uniref:non-specific serine/threonine protein kinase n=1 Tax=Dillenia turbinata TaxID=194707 RepID=A0AAN8VFI6_9MAGN